MIGWKLKSFLWKLAFVANVPWALYYRIRYLRAKGGIKINVACGQKYARGWLNIDGNPLRKSDMWLDVMHGLPFRKESVEAVYSSHFLEHLCISDAEWQLKEWNRVLKPGGAVRIVVPSLENAVDAYSRNDSDWFGDWPLSFQSVGGRFVNFVLCDSQHLTMFDFGFLTELLGEAGYRDICRVALQETKYLNSTFVAEYEKSLNERSLFVEARKGGGEADGYRN